MADKNDSRQNEPPHDLSILLLRLYLGFVFLFHGGRKIGMFNGEGIEGYTAKLKAADLPLPEVVAWSTAGFGLVGGLFIMAGFCTRLAVIPLMCTTTLTILFFHSHAFANSDRAGLGSPYGGYEFPLMQLVILSALLISGAGRFSAKSILIAAPKR